MDDDQKPHVGPPDLILQAIVPPTDAPAEIRAAVADKLSRLDLPGLTYTWEDIGFAASVIALVEGTNRRDLPDTQWVFALSAEEPKLGEQVHSAGSWASTIQRFGNGDSRNLWRVCLFDTLTTAPRAKPEAPAA